MTVIATVVVWSAAELDRERLESLDRQSLRPAEIEVLVTDPGNDPALSERLSQLVRNRTNYRRCPVPADSTPGERLDAAVHAARGRYVLLLGPGVTLRHNALQLLCGFADEAGADVCLGRSPRALLQPLAPEPVATDVSRLAPEEAAAAAGLGRVYRRDFLLRHGLVVRGAGPSAAGLDAEAVGRADVVALVGRSQPFAAAGQPRLADVADDLAAVAESAVPAELRTAALLGTHRRGLSLAVTPGTREPGLRAYGAAVERHLPSSVEDPLTPAERELSQALRRSNIKAVRALRTRWRQRFQAQLLEIGRCPDGVTLHLLASPGKRSAPLPQVRPPFALRISLYSRERGVEWFLPAEDLDVREGERPGTVSVRAVLRPDRAAAGARLGSGVWWPVVVVSDGERTAARGVRRSTEPLPAFTVSGQLVVFGAKKGRLGLDVGGTDHPPVRALDAGRASVTEDARGSLLTVPVPHLDLLEGEELQGKLRIGKLPVPASVRAGSDGAVLRAWVSGLPGDYRLATKFSPAAFAPTRLSLAIGETGRMVVRPS